MASDTSSQSFPRLAVGGQVLLERKVAVMPLGTMSFKDHLALLGSAEPYFNSLHHIKKHLAQCEIYGRGGAAFPLSRKLAAYEPYKGKLIVVANGSESEYLSQKDAALLVRHPHLVLDGLSILSSALGAKSAYIHLKSAQSSTFEMVERALGERGEFDPVTIELSLADSEVGYPGGVESAVISSISGMGGKPIYIPRRPILRGIKRRPTMISNVETLAQLALLARFGGSWFSAVGGGNEAGTRLMTVASPDGIAKVVEVVAGTPFSEVFDALSIYRDSVKCGLLGGYFGQLLDADKLWSLHASMHKMKEMGVSLGAGVVALSQRCPLVETAQILKYLANQTSGQCGPCYMGLPELASLWWELSTARVSQKLIDRIIKVGEQIKGRGGCAMPDGAVMLSVASLANFKQELFNHQGSGCTLSAAGGHLVPMNLATGR